MHLKRAGAGVYTCTRTGRTFDGSIARREQATPCPFYTPKPRRRGRRRRRSETS